MSEGIGGWISDLFGATNQYSASAPPITQQNFMPGLGSAQAQQNQAMVRQNDIYNQQRSLAQMLLAQSQGLGPNPVQASLNQNTGANIANQAALMASQRGASVNPALIAQMAARQGAATQQQSIGQAATLQAQQQINAQQALQQQQQMMNQLAYGQGNQALQAEQIRQSALAAQNSAITQGYLGAQGINANVSAQNAQTRAGILGGLIQAGGSALGLEEGGIVPGQAEKKGDSPQNDRVPAMLSPGEVVLPRSVTQSKDPVAKAAEFMQALMQKENEGYGGVIKAKKSLKERVDALEKMMCSGGKV